MIVSEAQLHQQWLGIPCGKRIRLASGKLCRVISHGEPDQRDGPDFYGSRLFFDGHEWSGHVEIHNRSSDWYRHGHQHDAAYNNVILHVVKKHDKDVQTQSGRVLPTYILPNVNKKKDQDKNDNKNASCIKATCNTETGFPAANINEQMNHEGYRRLERKAGIMQDLYTESEGDVQQWAFLAMAYGAGIPFNSVPALMLARSIPAQLRKKTTDIVSTTAILLGQAGLLRHDDPEMFHQEYSFRRHQFKLQPLEPFIWINSPMRPLSRPRNRIIWLSSVINQHPNLFSFLCQDAITNFPETTPHFRSTFLINVVAPFLMAAAKVTGTPKLTAQSQHLINELPPEKNKIIHTFVRTAGFRPQNALQSQGLLELHHFYCKHGQCEFCPIKSRQQA